MLHNLESFAPFNRLESGDLQALSSITTFKTFVAKEIVLYENTQSNMLYFLCEGLLKLYKVNRFENEIFLGILENGLLLDLNLDDTQGNFVSFANIEALQDCIIAQINGENLHALLHSNPRILALFFKETTKKLNLFEEVIQKNLVFDSTAKIAYTLYFHLDNFNAHKKSENASFLNIQPETLSRTLTKLHRENILTTNKQGKIEILNLQKLYNIFKQD
ncbi:Crp/Fnr family transcriptional regulator [Helicobacter sp. MIT 05-5294]|uniref:Crp/Fnr family transcriptional regulator n=1 Tax=Helicobacter sp. MIT 05-5294 TaxID=1548150 RepID=UPI000B27CAC2|nr:Crp/Fnr family transcriptional regulator [Helicobacter sp. MIT 05-5294]